MQANLWKKVEELYQAALAQPRDKRAAFLSRKCSALDGPGAVRWREAWQLRDCRTARTGRHG
jgi:hypothetical protein